MKRTSTKKSNFLIFDGEEVIGEITKVNFISENGKSYIKVSFMDELVYKYFNDWASSFSKKYGTRTLSVLDLDSDNLVAIIKTSSEPEILSDNNDWFGNPCGYGVKITGLIYDNITDLYQKLKLISVQYKREQTLNNIL